MAQTKAGAKKRWSNKFPGGLIQRFFSKVESSPGCWLWKGTTTGKSHGEYGTFWNGERIVLAHRFLLELTLGRKLKPKMNACHRCDVPLCIRPTHLYEGTQSQNNKDAYTRKRRSGKKQSEMLLKARKKKLGY